MKQDGISLKKQYSLRISVVKKLKNRNYLAYQIILKSIAKGLFRRDLRYMGTTNLFI